MTGPIDSTMPEGSRIGGLMPDSQVETAAQSPEEGKLAAERSANLGPVVVQGYEVLEEVGRGMMGVVYKARDVRLNRLVALKVVQGESVPDSLMLIRFLAEAE